MAPKENNAKSKEKNNIKIDKWEGAAVKNSLDDVVKDVLLNKYNYIEKFTIMDGKLCISAIAVGVAMFALLWDYLYPYPESKPILIFSVTTYFVMMGVLSLYVSYKEQGTFTVCVQKDGARKGAIWDARSFLAKHNDVYELHLYHTDPKTGAVRHAKSKKSCANYIDVNGVVCKDLIENEVSKLHDSLLSERKGK